MRHRARSGWNASGLDLDRTESSDRVGANSSHRVVVDGKRSRPPWRRDRRDAAHSEG
jgi:hypothetical protein